MTSGRGARGDRSGDASASARRRERGFADLQKLDQIGGEIGPRQAEIQDVLLPSHKQHARPAAVVMRKGDELHCFDLRGVTWMGGKTIL